MRNNLELIDYFKCKNIYLNLFPLYKCGISVQNYVPAKGYGIDFARAHLKSI